MESEQANWKSYPRSLPVNRCNPYAFDVAHYDAILNENSNRLFGADAHTRIKIIENDGRGVPSSSHQDHILRSLNDVESYVNGWESGCGKLRIV